MSVLSSLRCAVDCHCNIWLMLFPHCRGLVLKCSVSQKIITNNQASNLFIKAKEKSI